MSHPTTSLAGYEPDWFGQFTTFDTWVNKAAGWIDGRAVCIDAKGRRCFNGGDFMRARDEDAFPVRFFWTFKEAGSPGERVRYTIDGRTGVADEFLSDGDTFVTWDDGTFGNVKWNHLEPAQPKS
jgi:hypothetical protein